MGNFVFHSSHFGSKDFRLNQTFIVKLNINTDYSYDVEMVPVKTLDKSISIMKNPEKEVFFNRLLEISEVLENNRKYKHAFYLEAINIVKKSEKSLKATTNSFLLLAILKRLKKIQKQDILLKLYSYLYKN